MLLREGEVHAEPYAKRYPMFLVAQQELRPPDLKRLNENLPDTVFSLRVYKFYNKRSMMKRSIRKLTSRGSPRSGEWGDVSSLIAI